MSNLLLKSLLLALASLWICGCNLSNEPVSKPDKRLFANLYSGINAQDVKDSLAVLMESKKMIEQERSKDTYLYVLNTSSGGKYLFSVWPQYHQDLLYKVKLDYKGELYTLYDMNIQNIMGRTDNFAHGSGTPTHTMADECVQSLSAKYGKQIKGSAKNIHRWVDSGVEVTMEFYDGNSMNISYTDLSIQSAKNSADDTEREESDKADLKKANQTVNDL